MVEARRGRNQFVAIEFIVILFFLSFNQALRVRVVYAPRRSRMPASRLRL
jgi:hypothetical protein